MRGIYVIVITFLAFWAHNEVIAKEDQLKQSIWKKGFYEDDIPIKCPYQQNITTNIAHETDCTQFYKCLSGKKILLECPLVDEDDPNTRLHYNRREQVCDWPWRAGCANCPLQDKNGNWSQSKLSYEPENCSRYYVCINGEKHLEYCPPNTCFSRTCQNCVVNRSGGNCDQ